MEVEMKYVQKYEMSQQECEEILREYMRDKTGFVPKEADYCQSYLGTLDDHSIVFRFETVREIK